MTTITKEQIKAAAKSLGTTGYTIIADGQHSHHKTLSKSMMSEVDSIIGPPPRMIKNFLGALLLDYDSSEWVPGRTI